MAGAAALQSGFAAFILSTMTEADQSPAPTQPEHDAVFLDAELAPHRSLPPSGFVVLMAILGGLSFIAGVVFVWHGAWPVTGFFGLEVGLVYLAFRLNYRSGRRRERVRLVEDSLTVERIGVRGDRRKWSFQPYWLRVTLEEKDEDTNRLVISSHGRHLALATFLGAGERREFATVLKDAMARWRARLGP
ncbi:MAG: hypothetical protein JWL84_3738 [Rhodospirillales bacterium]|nr:hypothetical protein [Rhodospirillales bacterium]